jgi:uncharacterized protein
MRPAAGPDAGNAIGLAPEAARQELAPVTTAERAELIDVVRGFALFGILLVNVQVFGAPLKLWFFDVDPWPGPLDRAVELAVAFFAEGKFYTLFSILFGLGLSIQVERAEARDAGSAGFLARRMSWLLAIGLGHALLIWMGDILAIYAVVGFLTIPFRKRRLKTLAIWAAGLLALPSLMLAVPAFLVDVPAPNAEEVARAVESATAAYSSGDLARIHEQRVNDVLMVWAISSLGAPSFLGLFLLGTILGRLRLLRDTAASAALARRWIWRLLGLGLAGNLILVVASEIDSRPMSPLGWTAQTAATVGLPALTLFYVAAIVLLAQRERWRRRLAPLAAVGRMALTNYLLQSLVCTAIFNGYGWVGLYGRVSTHRGALLAVALYGLQVPWSNWWLRRWRFGPMEWLWRSLTYRRLQPMRHGPAST